MSHSAADKRLECGRLIGPRRTYPQDDMNVAPFLGEPSTADRARVVVRIFR